MKDKSLRQLARELGVSASYLSQVKNGKRPASQKVLSKVLSIDQQDNVAFAVRKRYNSTRSAEVAQSVEQRTENPRVPSSNLGLGTML
jgi:transcriptional regulator with XRE-family HTH domain